MTLWKITSPPNVGFLFLQRKKNLLLNTLNKWCEYSPCTIGLEQRIYKNMVKNDRNNFDIPAHLLCNEEIQSRKIQNYINYFEFFYSGFPRSHDKRLGISKLFLSFFILFLYIPWPGDLVWYIVALIILYIQIP